MKIGLDESEYGWLMEVIEARDALRAAVETLPEKKRYDAALARSGQILYTLSEVLPALSADKSKPPIVILTEEPTAPEPKPEPARLGITFGGFGAR